MLVLERLSDAERNGHQVLATIRGSAVNQDGASNGLTAPNGPSQERVIRQALANARLDARRRRRGRGPRHRHHRSATRSRPAPCSPPTAKTRDEPLRLGSIKSNIGHTQAAAGVAGVIKMVQAMRARRRCRRPCTSTRPPPRSTGRRARSSCSAEESPWAPGDRPRRAGVSSFGISGTNAHVILEEAPAKPGEAPGSEPTAASGGEAPLDGPLPGPLRQDQTRPARGRRQPRRPPQGQPGPRPPRRRLLPGHHQGHVGSAGASAIGEER